MTLSEFVLAWRALAPVVRGKCFYCGKQTNKEGKPHRALFMTKDHVIPQSAKCRMTPKFPFIPNPKYSSMKRGNCVVCCRKCNSMKSDLTLEEFKLQSGIATFYAEEVLGVRIDDLSDIAEVTLFILNTRKTKGRSNKLHGRTEPSVCPQDSLQPASDS